MVAIDKIQVTKTDVEITRELRDLFISIGVNYRSRGFRYLITACTEVVFNPKSINNGVTKVLYPSLAKEYDTTPGCIERCIRSSIENIDLDDNPKAIEIFGHIKKLSNSIFIAAIADYIRINSL